MEESVRERDGKKDQRIRRHLNVNECLPRFGRESCKAPIRFSMRRRVRRSVISFFSKSKLIWRVRERFARNQFSLITALKFRNTLIGLIARIEETKLKKTRIHTISFQRKSRMYKHLRN